jgi:hypothetical protein
VRVSTLTEEAAHLEANDELRRTNRKLLRLLEHARASKAELVQAVYQAALETASTMVIPKIPTPKVSKGTSPEIAICLLADWQLGKTTPDYNSDVAAERVQRYAEKVVALINLQRSHHPVNEARIYLLGDLLEGEEIFPGQAHRIDASLYTQVFRGAELLASVVRAVAAVVDTVVVKGAIGNHGSLGGPIRRSYHPETNLDAMLYNVARMLVNDPRVEWAETHVAGERAWYATDEVFDKTWFLFHGDQVKSASFGIPWYGFNKRLLGWATSVHPFEYSASGHWHVPVRMQVNGITHWGAGSTESSNTFAQEFLASGGQRPSQWLLFQGEHGVSAEYVVYLDPEDMEVAA